MVMLFTAFFSPYLAVTISPEVTLFVLFVLVTVLSGGLGFWWYFGVCNELTYITCASNSAKTLDEVLKKRATLFAPVGGGSLSNRIIKCDGKRSVMILISSVFVPSIWFVIAAMAFGLSVGILSGEISDGRGIFGNLLQSKIGVGTVLTGCMYLTFFSLVYFTFGLLAFINKGDSS